MSDELSESEADVRGFLEWGGGLARPSSLRTLMAEYDRRADRIAELERGLVRVAKAAGMRNESAGADEIEPEVVWLRETRHSLSMTVKISSDMRMAAEDKFAAAQARIAALLAECERRENIGWCGCSISNCAEMTALRELSPEVDG